MGKAKSEIDRYIAEFPADVQKKLQQVRAVIREVAPADAQEAIKYRIPTFVWHGNLVFFAGFKQHIGLYPPISGPAALKKKLAQYAGERGNLRFPLDEPIPYELIRELVRARIKETESALAQKRAKKPARKPAPRAIAASKPKRA